MSIASSSLLESGTVALRTLVPIWVLRATSPSGQQIDDTYGNSKHENGARKQAAKAIFCKAIRNHRPQHHSNKREREESGKQSPVEALEAKMSNDTRRRIEDNNRKRCAGGHARIKSRKEH